MNESKTITKLGTFEYMWIKNKAYIVQRIWTVKQEAYRKLYDITNLVMTQKYIHEQYQ